MGDDSTERDFHHPFEPYEIQRQFMNAVYDCLDTGKVGIFESPTGTGKSLSLICGSLTWLRDHQRQKYSDGSRAETTNGDEPAWLLEHAREQRRQAALQRKQDFDQRIAKIKAKEARLKQTMRAGQPPSKRQKTATTGADAIDSDEARFILDDYDSDAERRRGFQRDIFDESGLSAETLALMEKLGQTIQKPDIEEDVPDETRIFFCSRTHSQLSQFASELRRVKMPSAVVGEAEMGSANADDQPIDDAKLLTLGSRKNLCINPKINKLSSATAINERCLELQQPNTSQEHRCKFMPSKENKSLVNDFRDHALARVRDIEDLGSLGKTLSICPYYASRPAIKYFEIVSLPYPLLLQKAAREALDLSLKDHIIIIDEAHNLMDAISGIYSVSVSLAQLKQARIQLTVYLQKYRNRLKGKNRTYVAQTLRLIDSLIAFLEPKDVNPQVSDGEVAVGTLTSEKGADQINIFKLIKYLQESHLARKVDSFTQWSENEQSEGHASKSNAVATSATHQSIPVLTLVQSFLLSLMNPSTEGRFFFSREELGGMTLKYMLLDPTHHFKEIVEDARAVVLAGGTMSPMSDYEQHLFPYLPASEIMTLSCGHVIPPSNLLAVPLVKAASGREFDFTFEKRNSDQTMIDLGIAIIDMIKHIPDGVVVFIPSYSYLDTCLSAWKRLHPAPTSKLTIWGSLQSIKPTFLEQRTASKSTTLPALASKELAVQSILAQYSAAIASGSSRGALLFAVIGGTLSEGINFSDALGRGILVVGLPFPNPHAAEWRAKSQYISSKAAERGADGKAAAREIYENACMRAVNQCVGRAIRHNGDYAAIVMLDRRYGGERIKAKLPGWIRENLREGTSGRQVGEMLGDFFRKKM